MTSALIAGGAAVIMAFSAVAPALSQNLDIGNNGSADISEEEQLLLAADELIYDQDRDLIIASGGVQVSYGKYRLVAQTVEYNQTNGRVRAIGNVELVEPSGNRIYSDEIDVTDNFARGFVKSLRIETPDDTRIAASSAQRVSSDVTVYNNGVYTACPKCEKNPEKPPFWQIKSKRVISNGKSNTIRFESPSFEIGGVPILRLPSFTIPAHNSTRRSGFLIPSIGYSDKMGFQASVPYYFAISPHMDATLTTTGYSEVGFMSELEFRQKFNRGSYSVKFAGAHQTDPMHFDTFANKATVDGLEENRGMVATSGEFNINSKWKFGWNGVLQSDANFAKTYQIDNYKANRLTSEVYLNGLGTTSYFDLRAYKFDIQDENPASTTEMEQADVLPILDYSRIFSENLTGGDVKLTVNAQSLSRDLQSKSGGRVLGLDGTNSRFTTEVEWKKQLVTEQGLVLTPLLAARGDVHQFDVNTVPAGLAAGGSESRGMVTAGLEAKYPLVAQTGSATHVFEPVAQIFVRPDERLSGGLPNEDSQSFVFDAANLFERDKFSGFDRIEGGSRANVGLRYSGTFSNGFTANAVFGQSYHLAGKNSFAQTDLTGAGADSGLETDVSDFVASVNVNKDENWAFGFSGQFDKDNFDVKRTTIAAGFSNDQLTTNLAYSKIAPQTGYGSATNREEVTGDISYNVTDEWRLFGKTTFDIDADNFTKSQAGLAYENECYIVTGVYNHTHSTSSAPSEWSVGMRMSFRTLGTLNAGSSTGKSF